MALAVLSAVRLASQLQEVLSETAASCMPAWRNCLLLGLLHPAVQTVTKAQLDNGRDSVLILPSAHRRGWLTLAAL